MPPITNRGDLMARTWQVSLHIQPRPVSQHSTNTVSVGSQALCGIPAEMHWVDCLPLSLLATVVRTSTMASPPKDRGAPAVQKHGAVSRSMLSLMPIPRRDHEGLLRVGELQADHGRYRQASSGPGGGLAACIQVPAPAGVHVQAWPAEGGSHQPCQTLYTPPVDLVLTLLLLRP